MAANGYQMHILIGNLGADPKVNTTRSGQKVTNFDLAVNERNSDGREVVTWYGIAAWNGCGEVCAQYLKKGRSVMVEGTRMHATAWFGRDGNLYTKMELTANEVKFLGGNGNGASNGNGNSEYHNGNGARSNGNQPQRQTQRQTQRTTSQRTSQARPQRTSQAAPQQHQAAAPQQRQAAPQQLRAAPQQLRAAYEHQSHEQFIPNNADEIPF